MENIVSIRPINLRINYREKGGIRLGRIIKGMLNLLYRYISEMVMCTDDIPHYNEDIVKNDKKIAELIEFLSDIKNVYDNDKNSEIFDVLHKILFEFEPLDSLENYEFVNVNDETMEEEIDDELRELYIKRQKKERKKGKKKINIFALLYMETIIWPKIVSHMVDIILYEKQKKLKIGVEMNLLKSIYPNLGNNAVFDTFILDLERWLDYNLLLEIISVKLVKNDIKIVFSQ